MENKEDLTIVDSLGLPEGSLLCFDTGSIPDGITISEYIDYIKQNKIIPFQSYTDTFIGSKLEDRIRSTQKPYIICKDNNKEKVVEILLDNSNLVIDKEWTIIRDENIKMEQEYSIRLCKMLHVYKTRFGEIPKEELEEAIKKVAC